MTANELQLLARTTCQTLLITCSDFRFKAAEQRFAAVSGLTGDYDLIARPGAIRSLVMPRSTAARDTMQEEMRLLWGLHKFRRVLALNHLSCRAYDDLATAENEHEVHMDHLRRARPIIEQPFADVRAELYLAVVGAQGVEIISVPR